MRRALIMLISSSKYSWECALAYSVYTVHIVQSLYNYYDFTFPNRVVLLIVVTHIEKQVHVLAQCEFSV